MDEMPIDLQAGDRCVVDKMTAALDAIQIEQLTEHIVSEPLNAHGELAFKFLDEDLDFQRIVAEGGENPSAKVDRWARNRLTEFRKFKKFALLPHFDKMQPADCVALLVKFFKQVCKRDGNRYPTQSLMGLYRAFNRILRKAQEQRIVATGIVEPPFKMRESVVFKPVATACVLAMKRSRDSGANLKRKKAAVITVADECVILADACTNPLCPRGLQRRAIYFLLCRFGIRGGDELYRLNPADFSFGSNGSGHFVSYNERLSKNYKVTMDCYQEEHFRPEVLEYDVDVVQTLHAMIKRLPPNPVALFQQPIENPRTPVWYNTTRVSVKKLSTVLKEIHGICGLETESVSNKLGRTTLVTRMAAEGVPTTIGMKITGHKSQGAYERYDRSVEAQVRAAQKLAGQSSKFSVNVAQETADLKENVIGGRATEKVTTQDIEDEDEGTKDNPEERAKSAHLDGTSEGNTSYRGDISGESGETEVTTLSNNESASKGVSDQQDKYDFKWANEFDWDSLGSIWKEGGAALGPVVSVNPIQAVFGKIGSMSNCHVSINFGVSSKD